MRKPYLTKPKVDDKETAKKTVKESEKKSNSKKKPTPKVIDIGMSDNVTKRDLEKAIGVLKKELPEGPISKAFNNKQTKKGKK